jgi:peroxiredoxin
MRLIVCCLLFLISCFISQAGQSLIQGNAPDYKGKFVRLYVYDDYITYTEKELTSTRVGLDGKFELWFSVTETKYAFIRIDNEILDLYIERDNKYKIYFPPPFTNTGPTNPLSERNYHKLILPASDTTSLNYSIQKFNQMYDDFLYVNKELIVRRGMSDKKQLQDRIIQLRDEAGEELSFSGNVYLKDHIQYSIAQLEVLTMMTDFKLFENYFNNKPFLEYNYEFMRFFHQHFEKHLKLFGLTVQGSSFVKAINNFTSIENVNQALHFDEKLRNKILRDAVLIDGLIQLYNNPDFKKDQIVRVLDTLTLKAATPYLRIAAVNAKTQLTRNEPSTQAPEFDLRSHNNQLTSLKDFAGKYIYLQFTDVSCLQCNSETKTVSDLHKKYGNKVQFVTITINNDFEETRDFVKRNAYNWTFLIAGDNHKVLEDYNVKSVPEYFFIGPEGKFVQSPATRPDRGIDRTFFDLK